MSAPLKPWERAALNNQNGNGSFSNDIAGGASSNYQPGSSGPSTTTSSQAPPPVPTRPSQQSSLTGGYGSYGSYGSGFGGAGGYGYGGSYGGFGSGSFYSPYGSGMYGSSLYNGGMYGGVNRFGGGAGAGADPNSFVRMAEENSRQAFQSIEGIVQAVGSVAMMLESTYSAVYNSFRAVIGVADHFSRMKSHFAQIFSALALVRTLRWLLRRLLVLLRLREALPDEQLWTQAAVGGAGLEAGAAGGSSKPATSWPLLLFFAVIMGGPWLIWRFLSSLSSKQADNNGWASGEAEHFVALAEHDFEGERDDELSVRRGQRVNIAPKELQPRMRGWLLAAVNGKVGIIPANYMKILGKRRGTKAPASSSPAAVDPSEQSTGPAPIPSGQRALTGAAGSGDEGGMAAGGRPGSQADLEAAFNELEPEGSLEGAGGYNNDVTSRKAAQSVINKEASDILDERSNNS